MLSRKVSNDLEMYDLHAKSWWSDEDNTFRSLKALSPFKLSLINKYLGSSENKQIVDLGCGGGLLSIPLAMAGGMVKGVDISVHSLHAAREQKVVNTEFIKSDIRDTKLPAESADWVLLADVVDHLSNYPLALKEAYRLLKPGGKLYLGTINRTASSKLLAIYLGEGLGLIPRGTHDWNLFVRPEELVLHAKRVGFELDKIVGESVNFFKTLSRWAIQLEESKNLSLAYSAFFTKKVLS